MNLTKYWGWQAELDSNILETHNLVENEEMLQKKILSLNVEVGEVANEWRGFKFWSTKPPSSKEKILEEWVDCLHFTLSIGNQLGYKVDVVKVFYVDSVLNHFETIYKDIARLSEEVTEMNYIQVLNTLISLGANLGFTVQEIEAAYLSKNETNHKRQEDGY